MERKHEQKKQLAELKNKYLVDIYSGLAKGADVKAIHQQLYEDTINSKLSGKAVNNEMLKTAMSAASALKRKVGSNEYALNYVKTRYGDEAEQMTGVELLAIFAFDLIDRNKIEKRLSHDIVKAADKTEGDFKQEIMDGSIADNRAMETPRIFYLASRHKDSASDHADYQGKVYIDEQWRSVVKDKELQREISEYIKQNNIHTLQWVMGAPVWFITRPNCRHYFKTVDTDEILATPKTKLLEKYKMRTAIGDRQYLQTINHSTSKQWYEDIRNAQLLLEKYKERLNLHKQMYAAVKNPIVKNAINKDRMLIDKWEEYINHKTSK